MVGLVGDMVVYLTDDSGDGEGRLDLGCILEVIRTELSMGYVWKLREKER